ncbi:hypothetical protein Hdeb2414_s0007g00238541 [Helianthus debilis subsp. tardiflorus]
MFSSTYTKRTTVASKDTSCESVVSSGQGQQKLTPQHAPRDASPAWSTFVHCRGNFNRVSFEGYWNRCRVGPDAAWNEGTLLMC